ncbi:MAG: Gfo/Idh/MocA family oxidoreductase [Kiritimatiellales bacterium]|nr:Gfo/Idh/MocA family oxidoreductase [Kiritimatiellales bacterium]
MKEKLNKTTRRGALLASAAFAAPMVVPASVLGRGGSTAPSNKITLGMIGHGKMMNGHMGRMLSDSSVQIVAVCDVDKTKRDAVQARVEKAYGQKGCDSYNEHERVTDRSDIDACFVVTPDHWHVPISLDAVRSGKDVYVEKPMSLTVKEGRILADAVRRYGRVLQVGSQQRSEKAFRKAAEMVRSGWIGKVTEVHTRLGRFPEPAALEEQPIPEGFDYDRWLGSTPWYPYNFKRVEGNYGGGWRSFWEYGARKNGDWGAHHYDIIQWALGKQYSGPEFFFPIGYKGREQQGFEYKDGPLVLRDHPETNGQMIHFIGEKGTVSVSRGNKLVTSPGHLAAKPLSPSDVHLMAPKSHHQNFLNSIRTRGRTIADVEIGHRTATVCHLSAISERLGRTLQWDPSTEQIVGDAEASKWLDRPRRAPYTL